ncbi:MAG: acyl-CoA synthetase [Myxococcota bacterium]|nr:acyl-CoA synthetase [Myxococcota bacterium]
MDRKRRPLLAVIGDASVAEDDPRYVAARALGRLAVDANFRLVTGGCGGVMEAASRGAHESERYQEGDVIGILPGPDDAKANPWVDIALPTGLGHMRNGLVARADVVVAVGGGAGTLNEMTFAWMHRRPLVALDVGIGWSSEMGGRILDPRQDQPIQRANRPEEAIEMGLRLLS